MRSCLINTWVVNLRLIDLVFRKLVLAIMLVLSLGVNVYASEGFAIEFEGMSLVKSEQDEALSHPLLLSAPKRINNSLRIDRQVSLQGTQFNYLYRIKPGYDIEQAVAYYLDTFSSIGSIEFRCEERNCGASNDWANKIFGESVLAGRDSNQEYFAGTIDTTGLHGWLSVYAVTNGRREPLIYLSFVPVSDGNVLKAVREGVLLTGGRIQGDQVAPLYRYLEEKPGARLILMSFNKSAGNSYEENLTRSEVLAKDALSSLTEKLGVDASRVQVKAMGNLGQKPLTHEGDAWLYLYLIN